MKRDFARLYSLLDLQPDCTLEEFKLACRRRIQVLHPDKKLAGGEAQLLPELLWLYSAATRFHRRHGRLPGSRSAPGTKSRAGRLTVSSGGAPAVDARDEVAPRRTRMVPTSLLVIILLILAVSWDDSSLIAPGSAEAPRSDPIPAARTAASTLLALGMDEASALAIQGEPLRIRDGQWDYGPSWLRFRNGRLVDWHSSALRRLKTATAAPDRSAAGNRN